MIRLWLEMELNRFALCLMTLDQMFGTFKLCPKFVVALVGFESLCLCWVQQFIERFHFS